MSKWIVVGGAKIENYEYVCSHISEEDVVVYCDCGLKHLEGLKRKPDLIIGDFDSYEDPGMDVETITLPHEKDDTDTAYAVKTGFERGFKDFVLVGVLGQRFDHSLGNMQLLYYIDSHCGHGIIVDDYSEIEVVNGSAEVEDAYPYFSLLNVSETAKGISIRGAKYELEDAVLDCSFPLGVSNEVTPGKTAVIKVREGRLLLVKVKYA